ncbi:MAG: hypothetical protein IJU12_06065 [Clostridia bacterium]|nr:hypothetical protein [Clostridia bacterium]
MRADTVDRMLTDYRRCAARRDFLRVEITRAEEEMKRAEERLVEENVLPGRGLDVPSGTGVGDPTARMAVRFLSGYRPAYMQEMAGDIRRLKDEMGECDWVCRAVNAWRGALSDRERLVIDRHVIGGESYSEVLAAFALAYPGTAVTSRDGLRRIKNRAMEKVYQAAGVSKE